MNQSRRREIASKGGRAAHAKGTAHQWSREEAREAGRKGGLAQGRRRRTLPSPAAESPAAENQGVGTVAAPTGHA
jgi:general stress protein YciG